MNYKLIYDSTSILRLTDNAVIPADTDNTDYQEYLTWLGEGNTPEPADLPPAPDVKALRHAAYVAESDPIFFKYQRGEATKEEWLAKVEEIKDRYPNH
jgi:hypothetical protein